MHRSNREEMLVTPSLEYSWQMQRKRRWKWTSEPAGCFCGGLVGLGGLRGLVGLVGLVGNEHQPQSNAQRADRFPGLHPLQTVRCPLNSPFTERRFISMVSFGGVST